MPPRLAHLLSGQIAEPRRYSAKERARLISERRYPPFAPMYALLQGRTLGNVARAAGISPYRLRDILRGRREPHFFTGLRLCKALGISPERLDRYLDLVQRNPLE